MKIAILISGGGSNMVALVRAMQSGAIAATPALVLSNRPDAGGLARARDMGVATETLDHRGFESRAAFETALHARIEESGADLICLAGFMRILTAAFIARWEGRILNIHPSLLPAFTGLNTHQRALDAGCTIHGCTVHLVTAALDDGPILGQAAVPVLTDDDATTLAGRVLAQEHRLYPAALARHIGGDQRPISLGLGQG